MRRHVRVEVSCAVLVSASGAVLACSSANHAGSTDPAVVEAGARGDDGGAAGDGAGDGATAGPGHVVFLHPDGHWRRLSETIGSTPEDLSAKLDQASPGTDHALSLSLDGAWVAGDATGRFGCTGGVDCVEWAKSDGSGGGLVLPSGAATMPDGRPAIAPGGTAIVYPKSQGQTRVDLIAVVRNGDGSWGAEIDLTASSPYPFAHDPTFSADGKRVAFDCGPSPYQDPATAICEAAIDGSAGAKVLVDYKEGPSDDGGTDWLVHHPAYAPDGSIVFEADWGPGGGHDEAIWRKAPGAKAERVTPSDVHDDNSPCVLPDGRIASLWLGRIEGDGAENDIHEVKVMDPDGSNGAMLLEEVDVVDVGLTCGE